MNDELREEIAARLTELDSLVSNREGWVRLRRGRGSISIEADRAGYVRLGLMLIHAGVHPYFNEPPLDHLLTRDSTGVIEKFLLKVKTTEEIDPAEEQRNTYKVAGVVLLGTVGVITVITLLTYLLSLVIHHV